MKRLLLILVMFSCKLSGIAQEFKYIKPKLTDSTKVVRREIDKKNKFERIYYIDYSKHSQAKKSLANFGISKKSVDIHISETYWDAIKNINFKPQKIKSDLPQKWVKIFKYKGEWILFDDLPKYVLTDSCLVTFDMDDPFTSVITGCRNNKSAYKLQFESYNWDNPQKNEKSTIEIKIIDVKRFIYIWKFEYNGKVAYELLIPTNQISNFSIMVMLETDLMDDENDIFDKIDIEKFWKE